MGHLNSVLFEGRVSDCNFYKIEDPEKAMFRAVISSSMIKKDEAGNKVEVVTSIDMYAKGNAAKSCGLHLTDGREIRVVGSLGLHGNGNVILNAEHVEFKPMVEPLIKACTCDCGDEDGNCSGQCQAPDPTE